MDGFIGEIRIFAGNFAPRDWAFCNGTVLPISQNTALFSILGVRYGGDGKTNFALPDLQGRVPIGEGQGPGLSSYPLGARGGNDTITLLTTHMPLHNHGVLGTALAATDATPSPDAVFASAPGSRGDQGAAVYSGATSPTHLHPSTISPAGGSIPINIQKPILGVNYIICLYGEWPQRQ